MNQPTVFDRKRQLPRPQGRAAWNASFEPVLAELRTKLRARLPEHLAGLAGAEWDAAASELRLNWLGAPYRVTWPALSAYAGNTEPGDEACPANVQGLFLYYLAMADGTPLAGQWISFRELPEGSFYNLAFQSYTGAVLARAFGDDTTALARAAQSAGGSAVAVSDCGHAFQVLPRVLLSVVYWRGDEEFPAQAQVLFDRAAAHYLPIDGLALLGSYVVQRLLKLAGAAKAER